MSGGKSAWFGDTYPDVSAATFNAVPAVINKHIPPIRKDRIAVLVFVLFKFIF